MSLFNEKIKTKIEELDKQKHIEIYKIFKKHNISLNENKSGTFINLSSINDKSVYDEVNKYLEHIDRQEKELLKNENIKQEMQESLLT